MRSANTTPISVRLYNDRPPGKLFPLPTIWCQKDNSTRTNQFNAMKLLAVLFWAVIFGSTTFAQDVDDKSDKPTQDVPKIIIVEGQITDQVGGGVKDVLITVHHQNADDTKGELIAETKTDEIGDYALTVSKKYDGNIIVTISKKTFQTITHHMHTSEDEFPLFIAESLQGTLQLKGVVRSADNNKPVEGADISLSTGYQDFEETSDSNGAFVLKNLSPGRANLTVSAKGFGRETISIQSMKDECEEELVIILKPERIINLIVRDDRNQPVSGVTIELYDRARDDLQTIVTNDKGKAIFSGIHFDAEELRARITHEDYVSSNEYDQIVTLAKENLVSHHEFFLQRAGKISGIVVDQNNQPLSGARIVAGEAYADASPRDWSTYDGTFTIGQVPPGETLITIQLGDYSPQMKQVKVQAGKSTRVEFRLKAGVSLVGFVRTEDSKPVPGAEIFTTTWHDAQTLGLRAMTNDEGRFEMRGVPLDEFEIQAITPVGHKKTLLVSVIPNEPVSIIVPTGPPPPRQDQGPAIGADVPAITLTSLTGQSFDLRSMKGKTILIDFWATWCGPCVAELPELEDIYKEFQSREDFVMISVSQDFDLSTLKRFIKKRKKMSWPQVYDDSTSKNPTSNVFGIEALPTIYIIGADGKIASKGLRGLAIGKKVHDLLKE